MKLLLLSPGAGFCFRCALGFLRSDGRAATHYSCIRATERTNCGAGQTGQKAAEKGNPELSAVPLGSAAADALGACGGWLGGGAGGAGKGVTWRKSSAGRKVRI